VKLHLPIAIFLLLFYFTSFAQNLNGFWKGTLTMRGCFTENNIELQLTIKGKEVTGTSYHYLNIDNYIRKEVKGTYDERTKELNIQEGSVITYNIPTHCSICIKNFKLKYVTANNEEILEGGWTGFVLGTELFCSPGTITLSRIKESVFKDIPEIKVDTGQIRLDFYDNGVVDGDSITVLVNKKVILSHQLLSTQPITTYVTVNLNQPYHEIEMVAENLGTIPPNTALLIITAGDKRYRLFLTSTESKSARIRLIYDKDSGKANFVTSEKNN
jgi:hypothetical protein